MKKTKERGITLIALVITIIILLILAGVTITQITQSGLFDKTKEAKNKAQQAENTENEILKDYIDKIDDYINDESKIKDYIITFNANDGVIIDDEGNTSTESTKTVTFGSTYGELPIPTREGYSFLGWFTADNKQIFNTSILSIEKNHTLYAQWAANQYTVTFDTNGGICDTVSKEVTFDSTYGELPTPTRDGHIFLGWYTSATGGEQILSETKVTTADNVILISKWERIVVNNNSFSAGLKYSLDTRTGSPGYSGSTSISTSGSNIKMTANGYDPGGNYVVYWQSAKYKIDGLELIGSGQTIQITTYCTLSSGSASAGLFANTTSLGSIKENGSKTYTFKLPDDGVNYSLYVSVGQSSKEGLKSTFNCCIEQLKIIE